MPKLARRATELDPESPEYCETLGSLYQRAGLGSRAQKMFDQVNRISRK